jgi:RNA recognition motif-containing protein
MNIFVGNLPFKATDDELRAAFEVHGAVDSARVIMDRESGRSRGFGFVEMPDDSQAKTAIEEMDGYMMDDRPLRVNEARPRPERRPRRNYDSY